MFRQLNKLRLQIVRRHNRNCNRRRRRCIMRVTENDAVDILYCSNRIFKLSKPLKMVAEKLPIQPWTPRRRQRRIDLCIRNRKSTETFRSIFFHATQKHT